MSNVENVTGSVDCFYITPEILSTQKEQLTSCIEQLLSRQSRTDGFIYSVTVFVDATTNSSLNTVKSQIESAITASLSPLPPLIIVAQAPSPPVSIAFEVIFRGYEPEQDITYGSFRGVPFLSIEDAYSRELVTGGVSHPDLSDGIDSQSQGCFEFMEQMLAHQGYTFADVVRQWNYIEHIVDSYSESQRYQIFNDVRSIFYSKADFTNGYPAATGIGLAAGGVTLATIAYKAKSPSSRILPLKNPLQSDAHKYTHRVLADNKLTIANIKTTPKFERGKIIDSNGVGLLHVSGTASIKGEETIEKNNVEGQTHITLDTIDKLINIDIIREQYPDLSYTQSEVLNLRVYVKELKDFQLALDVCSKRYPGVPTIVICADVCRPCLLVEIECMVRLSS